MKCAVCIEIRMTDPNELLMEAITQIDGTVFCMKHAKMKIEARAKQVERQNLEMAAMMKGIMEMKVGE